MNSVYRITGAVFSTEEKCYNECCLVMVGSDIKLVVSSYLDKFPKAEILEIVRLNYAGEEVFNVM